MSARRMPCKRCHHPRPVGTDGYCASCAEILRQLKLPKTVPPIPSAANKMDAQGGPRCACGKPSVFENGSCSDCAVEGATRVAGGETDPITERSSKVPTLPPAGAPAEPLATFGTDHSPGETVTYVAKNGDPDLAVLVSSPAAPSPLLENATVSVTAVRVEPAATLGPEKPPVDLGLFTQYTADDESEGGEDEALLP